MYPERVTITGRRRNADSAHEAQLPGLREQRGHDRRGPLTLHREETPVLVVHQVDPVGRVGFAEDLQHPLGVGRVRHDEVPIRAKTVDDQILDHPATLVQHEVVLSTTDLDGGHVVGDDALEEPERPGPRDLHLAEMRQVEQSDPLADRTVFREGPLVLDRHQPPAERTELRAQRGMLLLDRRVLELIRGLHRRHRTRGQRSMWPGRVGERG